MLRIVDEPVVWFLKCGLCGYVRAFFSGDRETVGTMVVMGNRKGISSPRYVELHVYFQKEEGLHWQPFPSRVLVISFLATIFLVSM